MSANDLHADDDALSAIAAAVRSAGERAGGLAAGLPEAPGAGDATAIVSAVLASLLSGAGQLTETAIARWSGVEESRTAYHGVEQTVLGALDRAGAGLPR